MLSSITVAHNLFDGVGTVLELGGGRDNFFVSNFINASSDKPVHFDNRGQGWDKGPGPGPQGPSMYKSCEDVSVNSL